MHNPQQSAAFLKLINALSKVQLTDSSYGNDVCDSACNEDLGVQVFFPNVTDVFAPLDSEDFTHFTIAFDVDGGNEYIDGHNFTLMEIISLLNALGRELTAEVDKQRLTMLDFIKNNISVASYEDFVSVLSLQEGEDVFFQKDGDLITRVK